MALHAFNGHTCALNWIDTVDSSTHDVACTRVPLFLLVWVRTWISAFAGVVISLIAVLIVLRMTLHPLDRDTRTRLWIKAVDHHAHKVALLLLSHRDNS